MWEASPLGGASGKPDADQKCAAEVTSSARNSVGTGLTALEGSGDLSSNGESNLPQVSNLREVDIFL